MLHFSRMVLKNSKYGKMKLEVRELIVDDLEALLDYWYQSSRKYFESLGADIDKLPPKGEFKIMLEKQLDRPYAHKESYALAWLADGEAIGHSNVNRIRFGSEATMHLHLWKTSLRKKGLGTSLVKKSIPYYFENLNLRYLWCEPYAKNLAPHKTLEKSGFDFVKNYRTVPGSLNFEQEVKQWVISREKYLSLFLSH